MKGTNTSVERTTIEGVSSVPVSSSGGFAIKALAPGDPAMTARLPEGKCEGLSDDGKLIMLRQVHRSCNPLPPRGQGRAATEGVVRVGGRVQ
jgi:hypothetical protein